MSTLVQCRRARGLWAVLLIVLSGFNAPAALAAPNDVRLISLAPGHFHAALVQKQMLPHVQPTVAIYAPLGFDLTEHIKRVIGFNTRPQSPTSWSLDVHARPDFLKQLRTEPRGSVVVISGRNAGKIDLIEAAVDTGMHVLVDKPWIIESADFERLAKVLDKAKISGQLAYDIMTERFEPTNALQRELVNTADVFGKIEPGTPDEPGVYIENVHHFMKTVAGRPNIRPAWFFDSRQQGEGMADTGTHLVDLVQWTLAPQTSLNSKRDVEVLSAQRWPTQVSLPQFAAVTAQEPVWPDFLNQDVRGGKLNVLANTQVTYKLRGSVVKMASMWQWQARPGAGDWHFAVYRGTRARIELRQGSKQKHLPELYVIPNTRAERPAVQKALLQKVAALAGAFPGISVQDEQGVFRVMVPAALRLGHEAHFSEVTRTFLGFLRAPASLPAWESDNMLTKYWVTTQATQLSQKAPPLASFKSRAPL